MFNLLDVPLSPLEKKAVSDSPGASKDAQVPRKTDPHTVRQRSFGTFQRPLLSGWHHFFFLLLICEAKFIDSIATVSPALFLHTPPFPPSLPFFLPFIPFFPSLFPSSSFFFFLAVLLLVDEWFFNWKLSHNHRNQCRTFQLEGANLHLAGLETKAGMMQGLLLRFL